MTLLGHKNHYNVKLLSGYGLSVKLKDNRIVLLFILIKQFGEFSNYVKRYATQSI